MDTGTTYQPADQGKTPEMTLEEFKNEMPHGGVKTVPDVQVVRFGM